MAEPEFPLPLPGEPLPDAPAPAPVPAPAPDPFKVPELYSPEYFGQLQKSYKASQAPLLEEQTSGLKHLLAGKGSLYGSAAYKGAGKLQEQSNLGLQNIIGQQMLEGAKYKAELPFKEAEQTGLYKGEKTLEAQKLETQKEQFTKELSMKESQWADQYGLDKQQVEFAKEKFGKELSFEESKWADQFGLSNAELAFEKSQWADQFGLESDELSFLKDKYMQDHDLDEAKFQEGKDQFAATLGQQKEEFKEELKWKKSEFGQQLTFEEGKWGDEKGIKYTELVQEKAKYAADLGLATQEFDFYKEKWKDENNLNEQKFVEQQYEFLEEMKQKKFEFQENITYDEKKWAEQLGLNQETLLAEKNQWALEFGINIEELNWAKDKYKTDYDLDEAKFNAQKDQFEAELNWEKSKIEKAESEENALAQELGFKNAYEMTVAQAADPAGFQKLFHTPEDRKKQQEYWGLTPQGQGSVQLDFPQMPPGSIYSPGASPGAPGTPALPGEASQVEGDYKSYLNKLLGEKSSPYNYLHKDKKLEEGTQQSYQDLLQKLLSGSSEYEEALTPQKTYQDYLDELLGKEKPTWL